jgi:predicted NodU family carbamoyl transferase
LDLVGPRPGFGQQKNTLPTVRAGFQLKADMHAPLILGFNAAYHESGAALIRGGTVVFAVREERFTRIRHAKSARVSNPDELPWNAIRACLEAAGQARLAGGGIIDWFHGRREFGPRAPGHRSMLTDPSSTRVRDSLN